jgi:cytochrome c oxidase subunit 2
MIDQYLQQVSTYAADIDNIFLLIGVIVGFWFLVAEGMFFYLMWRYRYRPGVPAQYITGKEKHLKRWINIPHALVILCDIAIIVAAVRVWYMVKMDLPEADATVRVVAQQWAWTFIHPGADGQLDTDDDIAVVDELHVKADTLYHFELESRDVLHSFSIPVFRLKQDVIPGRVITGWFEATQTGTFDLQCAEMCGIGHGIMAAQVFIESPEDHEAWIAGATVN